MHKVSPPVKAVRCCTGHEPLGSVVVRLFGNAGAQLGKDFLFGFRAGVKLAQALVGLTDIVESGVDTVQFHTFHRCQQQSVHVELGEFAGTEFPCGDFGFGENTPVDVVVRPEDIMLVGEDVGQMVGTIKSVLFKGVHYEMMIDTGAYTFKVHSTTMQPQGSRVGLNIVPFNIHIMKRLEDTTPAAEVDAEC